MKKIDEGRTHAGEGAAIRDTYSRRTQETEGPQATVDEASKESFPAGDAPAWTTVTGAGPPPQAAPTAEPAGAEYPTFRQAMLSRETRGEHDALLVAMHRLEAGLAAAAPGREEAWSGRVQGDLCLVHEALARHVASAEVANGLFPEIDLSRPTMVRRVERLRREHADLLQQASALQRQVEQLWCVEWTTEAVDERPNSADIRQRAAQLLDALRHHQAHEADLIFETFCTDLGAGD